jgi:hypothetical protein
MQVGGAHLLADIPSSPMPPYMWLCKRARLAVKLAHPDWNFAAIGRELGLRWRAAPEAERAYCQCLADADKVSYERVRQAARSLLQCTR